MLDVTSIVDEFSNLGERVASNGIHLHSRLVRLDGFNNARTVAISQGWLRTGFVVVGVASPLAWPLWASLSLWQTMHDDVVAVALPTGF